MPTFLVQGSEYFIYGITVKLEAYPLMTEEIFRLLFEATPHPYLVLRPDEAFTIVAVNERYLAATGTGRAMLNRGLFEVFPDNPGDHTATGVSDLRTSLERVKRERVSDTMGVQKYDIPKAGSEGPFEVKYWSPVNTPVFGADGTIQFIIHHVEDVTEFVLSRELASRESMDQTSRVHAGADRMQAEVLLRAGEVKEANRKIKAAMEELERRKGELARLNDQLQDLDRAKTAFFSNVSHEFRTPLTLMLGSLQEVLDDVSAGLPELQRKRLAIAQRNTMRLLKLVNALLDFTRIEAGRAQAAFEPADLSEATMELAGHFQSAFDGAGLTFTVDCQPLPAPVYADPDMWEKIVLNLLSNAFKFTYRGGVTVSLRSEGGHARLTVRDTGTGIPEHELPNLFQRFHHIEGAQGRSYEGSGIGLALVKELVELHGGTISAESVLGQGSAFHIAIPLGSSHLPQDRLREHRNRSNSAPRAEAFVAEALSWLPDVAEDIAEENLNSETARKAIGAAVLAVRPRVLLADDNADMRAYIGRLLSRAGYEVALAADGAHALNACLDNPPDLVLTDAMMPRLDGFELVAQLRSDERTALLPIILLSARAGEEARVEGLEAGADDYIVKPFGSRELLARVDAAAKLARIRKEAMSREMEMARLRASFEDAAVGMAHVAPNGRWLRVNDRLCAMTGYARDELLAKTSQEITHPDDLDADLAALRKLLAGEIASDVREKRYLRKDGDIVWVNLTASLVRNASGTPDYFVHVIDDITARKRADITVAESRSRLAGVVDSAMDAIISIDGRQNVVLFNGAAEKMFQRDASEIIGQALSLLLPQRFRAAHAEHILAFANTGVSNRAMGRLGTLRALRADGTEFPIEVSISQTSIAGEKLFTAILRDITERKRAEDTQRLLLAELDHRVKNTLATVQAIAIQTLNAEANPADFVESFSGRIQALGRAHGLLTRSSWQGADLSMLIGEQVAFGPAGADNRITFQGPRDSTRAAGGASLGPCLARARHQRPEIWRSVAAGRTADHGMVVERRYGNS